MFTIDIVTFFEYDKAARSHGVESALTLKVEKRIFIAARHDLFHADALVDLVCKMQLVTLFAFAPRAA